MKNKNVDKIIKDRVSLDQYTSMNYATSCEDCTHFDRGPEAANDARTEAGTEARKEARKEDSREARKDDSKETEKEQCTLNYPVSPHLRRNQLEQLKTTGEIAFCRTMEID